MRKTKNCDDNSWFVFLPRSVYNEDEWFKAHNLGYNWAPPNELEMILISEFLINPYQSLQSLRRSFRNQPPKKATSQTRKKKCFDLKEVALSQIIKIIDSGFRKTIWLIIPDPFGTLSLFRILEIFWKIAINNCDKVWFSVFNVILQQLSKRRSCCGSKTERGR